MPETGNPPVVPQAVVFRMITAVAEQARADPWEWMLAPGVYRTAESVRTYAYRVRQGTARWGHGMDAVQVPHGEVWRLWVRYTGHHLPEAQRPRRPADALDTPPHD
ncbi:MAG: hypothetical protein ACRCZP_16315 [Phycicoccus sp.]